MTAELPAVADPRADPLASAPLNAAAVRAASGLSLPKVWAFVKRGFLHEIGRAHV